MAIESKIGKLKSLFPLYSEDLAIDLSQPQGRFEWFLACLLFGARISEAIAANTYLCFKRAGIDTPDKILAAGWDSLVEILDSGGYVRYDFSTATKLLEIMAALKSKYGSVEDIYYQSSDTTDLIKRLREFKGIGPTTAQIFLRELRGVWEVEPPILAMAEDIARKLDINLDNLKGNELARVETALVKLGLRYCKRQKCQECGVNSFCVGGKKGCER